MAREEFEWENVRFVPIIHNKVEFALEVRRQFAAFKPEILAVEYPSTLEAKVLEGIERLPLLSVVFYEQENNNTFMYLPLEPTDGQVEAIRLAREKKLPIYFIDRDTEGYPMYRRPVPDPYSIKTVGYREYCYSYITIHPKPLESPHDQMRERTMTYHLQQLNQTGKRILFVGGLDHIPGILSYLPKHQVPVIGRKQRSGVMLGRLHRESSREIMSEMPFFAALYEQFRAAESADEPDRLRAIDQLIGRARESYTKEYKEDVSVNQLRVLNRFVMNYAFVSGYLTPDLYQILIAARGAVDDNFAYEVWEHATAYPWQEESPGLPTLRLRGEDLYIDQKKIKFHRHFRSLRRRLVPLPVKNRLKERYPGEWKQAFQGNSICSYQPEDIVVEGFGDYVKKRALKEKAEEQSRVVPFVSSMMDGIDLRETLRNLKDGTVYVRENIPLKGKVGSVVFIFDLDLPDEAGSEKYPWRVTWLGEHKQESDMAFYSTRAGETVIGPGISRCEYGGFMLTYPPLRVYDIWKDSTFDMARNKPERLLLAALDYSLERNVVYVASSHPSAFCHAVAARLGRKIIYLPIGTFSPITIKKIRQFHVLDGHLVRLYADRYI